MLDKKIPNSEPAELICQIVLDCRRTKYFIVAEKPEQNGELNYLLLFIHTNPKTEHRKLKSEFDTEK